MTYLVTGLLTGGELFERIQRKSQYSEAEAKVLTAILLETLRHLHGLGVVHRDLKVGG